MSGNGYRQGQQAAQQGKPAYVPYGTDHATAQNYLKGYNSQKK